MTTPITIDDHDPRVKYAGSWHSDGGSSSEVNETTSSSTNIGDSLTLQFSGTQIGVYGTIDSTSGGVITSYAIDGGTATQFTAPAALPSSNIFHQEFWTSPVIAPGYHNLVVTMVTVNPYSKGEGTIWFDYFLVTPNPPISKFGHAGAIAGAVAGGMVSLVVVLLAAVVMNYRRASRTRQREKIEMHRLTLATEDGAY